MLHPAMRFLILFENISSSTATNNQVEKEEGGETKKKEERKREKALIGFLSFMITEEDDKTVIYTYELDILATHQGLGLGKHLLDLIEYFGSTVGVEKSMLTVFNNNPGARRFYEREGYAVDESSPDVKILRNGLVKQPCYHILSKVLEGGISDGGKEDEEREESSMENGSGKKRKRDDEGTEVSEGICKSDQQE